MKEWKRPAHVPIPTTWRQFEGKKPLPNGQKLKFRIQDYTEDMNPMIIRHMMDFFIKEEPTCENLKLSESPEAADELKYFWDKYLAHNVALIAFVDNKDELDDKSLPELAGLNITAVNSIDDIEVPLVHHKIRDILGIVNKCSEMVNCFEKYKVSKYLYALGLSVHPAYRGQGLGLELLKARFDICKAVGLEVTVTVFTAIASQKIAEQAGFETLAGIDYEDYKDEDGNVIFKGMKTKTVKLMAAKVK